MDEEDPIALAEIATWLENHLVTVATVDVRTLNAKAA